MSDTPRTDSANFLNKGGLDKYDFIRFTRQLERELTAMTLERNGWKDRVECNKCKALKEEVK